MNQTIYKKDTKGKTRFLNVYNEGKDIVQVSGMLGTDNPVEARKEAKPKNIGRSNETTAEEQALKECEAIIVDKLTKGYFETIEEAETEEIILPMLAKDYYKEIKKIPDDETLIFENKLDGNRMLIDIDVKKQTVKLISRQGKEVTTLPLIEREAEGILTQLVSDYEAGALSKHFERFILDGEVYAGTDYTFQECMSLIKKVQPGQEVLQYVVYDMVNTDFTYSERKEILVKFFNTAIGEFFPDNKRTICLNSFNYGSKKDADKLYEEAMSLGYEGLMVKRREGMYKINGRSSDLLKFKKFFDIQLPIVDIRPTDARPEHGTVYVDYKGEIVKCGSKLSHAQREEILRNKEEYIGKTAEIRYFELTDGGSLRFPVYYGLRLDK